MAHNMSAGAWLGLALLQRCEWHRKVDELERSAITIFYAEGSGHAEGLARQIGALLDYERPPIVNLADIDTATFVKYKVSCGDYCCPVLRNSLLQVDFLDYLM